VIPSGGWLSAANNQNAPVTSVPLCQPFDATYTDVAEERMPRAITARVYNNAQATLERNTKAAQFLVRLRMWYLHDIALVDRIE
jgi:hypothetical protein